MRYCAAFLFWILAAALPAAGQAKKPAVVFDRTAVDAGTVTQGETVKQVFSFTNKGNGALEIMSVQPT